MKMQSYKFAPLAEIILIVLFPFQFLHSQWTIQTANAPDNLVDIVMLDSVRAIAIGDRNAILRTTDAGTTWMNETIMLSATFHWNDISFSDTLNGTIVGDPTVWGTTDGGITWKIRAVPSAQKCFSVLQVSPSSIWVGADSGYIYHSLDTGNTWTAEKISKWRIRTIFSYLGPIIFGGYTYYALTPYSICLRNNMPVPAWFEKNLSQFEGLGSEGFNAEFSSGGESGFIVGVQGDLRAEPTILRKKTSDTAWNKISTGILRDGVLYDISAPSANMIYVCGTGGMIFKSTNGGDAWKELSVPTTRNLHAVYFFDERRGLAVGDSGTILFTSNGGEIVVGVKEEALPLNFQLHQNYPNPFNPTTTIIYQIPIDSRVTMKIYDLLGREVGTLVDEQKSAGTYSTTWDASSFPSGVYFYRLRMDDHSSVKKLILLK